MEIWDWCFYDSPRIRFEGMTYLYLNTEISINAWAQT